jgi:hypothetical protein
LREYLLCDREKTKQGLDDLKRMEDQSAVEMDSRDELLQTACLVQHRMARAVRLRIEMSHRCEEHRCEEQLRVAPEESFRTNFACA